MILKSGNLLDMARLSFRVKCNNQIWESAVPNCCLLFESRHFFMEYRLFVAGLYMIKWQAILLRMIRSLRVLMSEIIFYPGAASLPSDMTEDEDNES